MNSPYESVQSADWLWFFALLKLNLSQPEVMVGKRKWWIQDICQNLSHNNFSNDVGQQVYRITAHSHETLNSTNNMQHPDIWIYEHLYIYCNIVNVFGKNKTDMWTKLRNWEVRPSNRPKAQCGCEKRHLWNIDSFFFFWRCGVPSLISLFEQEKMALSSYIKNIWKSY